MRQSLLQHDFETLTNMYQQESVELERRLLSGALWNEVKNLRKKVTDLASALHHKVQYGSADPASRSRNESDNLPV